MSGIKPKNNVGILSISDLIIKICINNINLVHFALSMKYIEYEYTFFSSPLPATISRIQPTIIGPSPRSNVNPECFKTLNMYDINAWYPLNSAVMNNTPTQEKGFRKDNDNIDLNIGAFLVPSDAFL